MVSVRARFLITVLVLITAAISYAAPPRHPDEVQCESVENLPGWNMDTAMDFSGEDRRSAYLYWLYKLFSPRLVADCRVMEYFRGRDLKFGAQNGVDVDISSTATISAVGDLMVRRKLDRNNAAHLYDDIEEELFGADIVFGNLETPVNMRDGSRAFPRYNLSTEAADMYLRVGSKKRFNIVSTANNHLLDQGEEGLAATLDYLDRVGIAHVGSSHSERERDSEFPIIEANGVNVAFLAYTFSTNGRPVPEGREYEVNLIPFNTMKGEPDISMIERHIQTARERGADIVAVSMHWGVENEVYPPRRIIDLGHRVAEAGADIILGHHPHILNPMEKYIPTGSRGNVPEVPIIYSMGNFIPDAKSMQNQTGLIINIEIAKGFGNGGESVWINDVNCTPVWFFCRLQKWNKDFRLINVAEAVGKKSDTGAYPFMRKRDWRELERADSFVKEYFGPANLRAD